VGGQILDDIKLLPPDSIMLKHEIRFRLGVLRSRGPTCKEIGGKGRRKDESKWEGKEKGEGV